MNGFQKGKGFEGKGLQGEKGQEEEGLEVKGEQVMVHSDMSAPQNTLQNENEVTE